MEETILPNSRNQVMMVSYLVSVSNLSLNFQFEKSVLFTLAQLLKGCQVINHENVLKLHGNLTKMLLTYYYKQVQTMLNNFPYQSPVMYLPVLWLE
jgi:hypothetical protein